MSNDLAFYVQFQVKPERLEGWKDAVREVIDRMSAESTFVSCYMHQDIQDANRFTLYERWNEPSFETFIQNQLEAKSYRQAYHEKLPDMLAQPRTVSFLSHVQEWHQAR
jgi:quinol monooxygenase YgiN